MSILKNAERKEVIQDENEISENDAPAMVAGVYRR